MDLILPLIMRLALRAVFHKARSGMVKEKDFQRRAQGCHSSEFLHCFFLLESDLWHLENENCHAFKYTKQGWTQPGCITCMETAMCRNLPNPPWDTVLSSDTVQTRTGGKLGFWAHFVLFCASLWPSPKIIQAPKTSAELGEENRNLGELWVQGQESEQDRTWGEQRELIPALQHPRF